MMMRFAIPIVLTIVLSSTAPALNAQALAPPRDDVETQLRAYGTRVRHFESVVHKRLDEIKSVDKDASDLRKRRNQEEIFTEAKNSVEDAKVAEFLAQMAIKAYEEGAYRQDWETANGEVALAEADVARCRDGLDWIKRKKFTSNDVIGAELRLMKAQFALEMAQTKRDVLLKYTKPKQIKQLQAEWEKAKSKTLQKLAELALAKDKLDQIHREIANSATPTDLEKKALTQLEQTLQIWKKLLAERAAFKGDIQAKREAFGPRFTDLERALETAEQSWDDAQEERLAAQDAEVELRIRDVLGTKPPG